MILHRILSFLSPHAAQQLGSVSKDRGEDDPASPVSCIAGRCCGAASVGRV